MDLKLNNKDKQIIEDIKEHEPIMQFLSNRDKLKFNIGDILICKKAKYEYNDDDDGRTFWEAETINSTNGLPRRYVYVHEDEFGVGYVKRLKVTDGDLGEELICLATIDHSNTRFEVDPLFLDSVLLGDGSFDIKALQKKEKEKRAEIVAFNKQSSLKSETSLADINKFLLQMKVGDALYYENNDTYYGIHVQKVKIDSIKEIPISRLPKDIKEDLFCALTKEQLDTKKAVVITSASYWGDKIKYYSHDFFDRILYNNKPRSIIGNNE
jgi:hypothetical protein